MPFNLIKRRFRRQLRKSQQQVEDLGTQAEQNLEQHLFKRFSRLLAVRRFVISWVLLLILLIGGLVAENLRLSNYFQTLKPVPGGIYNEGILGTFTTSNPLYATSDADSSISRLLFASLFTYNDKNQLKGDLASSYSVDSRGSTYTVHLKSHLKWHDGQKLTSADVVYTYKMIQNPDALSPLQSSWQGINLSAPDPLTVVFQLPDPLASFPYSLTNGIIPQHILAKIQPSELRSADFNTTRPVGSGPFTWKAIQVTGSNPSVAQEQIALLPFAGYEAGKPKLQEFNAHIYASQSQMERAFADGQLTGVEGLNVITSPVKTVSSLQIHNILLNAATMVFFKTSSGVLADQQVRRALVEATDTPQIINGLGYPAPALHEPLLRGQLGYDKQYNQAGFNLPDAKKLLDSNGWLPGKDGVRIKAGKTLSFTLIALDNPEYRYVTQRLRNQWQRLGAHLQVQLQAPSDFHTSLGSHNYDAVLYGISIGIDPDVFAYWDSSQADIRAANRLNLSEWTNSTADSALEAGRTRLDPTLRAIKYTPFLQAWQQDAPAVALYQPRLLYLTNGSVSGLFDHSINSVTDRFENIQNWEIRQAKITN